MSSGFLAWQVYILKHLQNLFVDRNHHIHDCHSHGPDHYYKNHGNSQRRSPALSHALVAFGLHLAFQSPTAQIQNFFGSSEVEPVEVAHEPEKIEEWVILSEDLDTMVSHLLFDLQSCFSRRINVFLEG